MKGTRKNEKCIVKKFIHTRARKEEDYTRDLMNYRQIGEFLQWWFDYIKTPRNNLKHKRIFVVQPIPAEHITENDKSLSEVDTDDDNDDDDDVDNDTHANENDGKSNKNNCKFKRSSNSSMCDKNSDNDNNSSNSNSNSSSSNEFDVNINGIGNNSSSINSKCNDDCNGNNCNCNCNCNDKKVKMQKISKLPKGAAKIYRKEWILVEPRLSSREGFVKYNSNNGDINPDKKDHMLQAFSHYTYHISKGQMVCTDLQGVETPTKIILTDPAILSMR